MPSVIAGTNNRDRLEVERDPALRQRKVDITYAGRVRADHRRNPVDDARRRRVGAHNAMEAIPRLDQALRRVAPRIEPHRSIGRDCEVRIRPVGVVDRLCVRQEVAAGDRQGRGGGRIDSDGLVVGEATVIGVAHIHDVAVAVCHAGAGDAEGRPGDRKQCRIGAANDRPLPSAVVRGQGDRQVDALSAALGSRGGDVRSAEFGDKAGAGQRVLARGQVAVDVGVAIPIAGPHDVVGPHPVDEERDVGRLGRGFRRGVADADVSILARLDAPLRDADRPPCRGALGDEPVEAVACSLGVAEVPGPVASVGGGVVVQVHADHIDVLGTRP